VVMRKLLLIAIASVLAVFSIWFWWSYYYTYSDGERSGLLQKMSHRGNVFKTYEGELVMNAMMITGAAPVSYEKFHFSVADEKVEAKLATLEGKMVTLHYQQKKRTLIWRGDSLYIVDGVTEVKQ
jgi:hypothetical protein